MKTFFFITLITIAMIVCACSSPTREPSGNPTPTPLMKICHEAALTQFDMNKCASEAADAAHGKLDVLLDELHNHMDMTQYQKLASIQEKWEQIVKEHCQWEADFFAGGSIQPMWLAGCLEEQYRQRIAALRLNLCEGRGMTGECEAALKYK